MALPRGELSTLLRDLRAAGPVDRVRLLARSLSSLRRLSPWDRKILLRMAGFEGAEALVERLAQEDEGTATRLRRLLGELEERPDELERTVRALADPNRRSQAVDEILATLDRGMGAEQDEPEDAPEAPFPELHPGPVPEPPPVPPAAAGSAPLPEAPPPPEPRPEAQPARAPEPPAKAAAPARPVEAPPEAPEPTGAPAEAPGDEALEPEEPELRPKAPPEPEARPVATRLPPAPTLTAPPEAADGSPASAVAVLERLLALRRRAGAAPPDARSLGRTLEREIPFPWARRRAIQAWIETGGAADLDGALALIGELPAAADRTWCLATLAERGPWSDGQWTRILEASPTPATRRRLDRRRGL